VIQKTLLVFLMMASFSMMFLSERPIYFAVPLWGLLCSLSFFDFKALRLPNILTALVLCLGIAYNIYIDKNLSVPLTSFLISSALLIIISLTYYKLRGRLGLGMGDIKLFAAGAVWLSPYQLPFVLLISSLTAILYFLISFERVNAAAINQKIPYGPFLAIAIWSVWLSGDYLIRLLL